MLRPLDSSKWGWAVVLASSTTLVCCTLPIVLVSLGLGAVSAALFANVPGVTFVAANKLWFFATSAVLIALGAWALFRPGRTCPSDPVLAARCAAADRWNRRLLGLAGGLWLIGFASAYLALPLYELIGE